MKSKQQSIPLQIMGTITRKVFKLHLKLLKGIIPQEVLLVIYKNPGIFQGKVIEKLKGSRSSIIDAVDHLIKIGLIKEEREKEFPRRRLLFPTEKGKRVGELLEKIEEVLRD